MDEMLTELYRRLFDSKRECERLQTSDTPHHDRRLQVEYAKNKQLAELVELRTAQIRKEG